MSITSLEVTFDSWRLNETYFDDLNLLVGISGVGKTQTLKALRDLRRAGLEGVLFRNACPTALCPMPSLCKTGPLKLGFWAIAVSSPVPHRAKSCAHVLHTIPLLKMIQKHCQFQMVFLATMLGIMGII